MSSGGDGEGEKISPIPQDFPPKRDYISEGPFIRTRNFHRPEGGEIRGGGSAVEDEEIVRLYYARDEGAIRQTEQKYGPFCRRLAANLLPAREDAEECVNDTWLRAWNAIPPQRPRVLRLFLARITRNLAFDRFQARSAEKRGGGELDLALDELAECLGGADTEAEFEARELGQCIRQFVRALPEREGNILVRRYFFADPVAEIAKRYGLSENNVMVILSRTRKKLKAHLLKEGYL